MATTTTPLFAVVGATDLAVERVRAAAANASAVQAQFDPVAFGSQAQKALLNQAQEAPTKAAARALEVAGRAEAAYEDLAERGKLLVDRVRSLRGAPRCRRGPSGRAAAHHPWCNAKRTGLCVW